MDYLAPMIVVAAALALAGVGGVGWRRAARRERWVHVAHRFGLDREPAALRRRRSGAVIHALSGVVGGARVRIWEERGLMRTILQGAGDVSTELPVGLSVHRRLATHPPRRVLTGDVAFDDRFEVQAADATALRLLSPEVRACLFELDALVDELEVDAQGILWVWHGPTRDEHQLAALLEATARVARALDIAAHDEASASSPQESAAWRS